ncbi:uncharacterized protein LOC141533958 [Cotesia typhae]|uniref:uncharacterized protein LOC141533958 n=1 Tax=Cotesia typhae TaxID=2053667 RepID=UPI003D697F1F
MNFRGLFVLIILQLYQDTVVSAFERNAIENYLRERDTVSKATKEVDLQTQTLLQIFSTKTITYVKEELETVSKDIKGYQKRSLIATSEYLTKAIADEIKPIKELLISLNAVKNIFHEELMAKVRSSIKDELKAFQRMELESLVLQVKNEIIESFRGEFADVKTTLQLEGAVTRDVINQTKDQAEQNLVNQQADTMIRHLKEKCEVKQLIETAIQLAGANSQTVDQKFTNLEEGIQNLTLAQYSLLQEKKNDTDSELFERLEEKIGKLETALKPNASCELTPILELIKTTVETLKNDRDARSEQMITKLVDKIERLITAKLKSRITSCELNRSTKATLAAIKAATDILVDTVATTDEENKLKEKFKTLLTELNANTTVEFDGVNSKLNAIIKTASSFSKSCREIKSSIQGILAIELDKFSGKQVKSTITAIGDVLANVSKSEVPKLGEGGGGGKSAEMSKLEAIEILVHGTKEKVKIELGEVEGRILKAFNETIVARLETDGKGCTEARGLPGDDDKEHSGGDDTEHTGKDMEHTGGDDTEYTEEDDTEHSGGDDTEHTGKDIEHTGGDDTEYTGKNDTEHSGGDDSKNNF